MIFDYSIEYSHIYTDENLNDSHRLSAKLMTERRAVLEASGASVAPIVLIDNYNPVDHILDIDSFLKEMQGASAEPLFVGFEADLAYLVDEVLFNTKPKISKGYARWIASRGKIPCSLFIAIWYLIRLGVIEFNQKWHEKEFPIAEKVITILPSIFKEVESKGLNIIKNSNYAQYAGNIETSFFDTSNNAHEHKLW